MIQPNELRIGNFITGVTWGDEATQQEILCKFLGYDPWDDFIWVDTKSNTERFEEFKPIPLTEEWLFRLGFENKCTLEVDYFKHIELPQLEFLNQGCDFKVFDSGEVVLTILKYVHQLQNFYHALIGQELTIKQ